MSAALADIRGDGLRWSERYSRIKYVLGLTLYDVEASEDLFDNLGSVRTRLIKFNQI